MNPCSCSRVHEAVRAFYVLISALGLAACVPFPHQQQEVPTMRGVLYQDGVPLEGITVRRAVNFKRTEVGCPSDSAVARTDANGKFSFPSQSYFSAFIVMGDRYDAWRICFDKPDGTKAIWDGGDWWGGPPMVELKCEIGASREPAVAICAATNKKR